MFEATDDTWRTELASRESNGITVRLFWSRSTNLVTVAVADAANDDYFELVLDEGEPALDVSNHPFVHASGQGPRDAHIPSRRCCEMPPSANGSLAEPPSVVELPVRRDDGMTSCSCSWRDATRRSDFAALVAHELKTPLQAGALRRRPVEARRGGARPRRRAARGARRASSDSSDRSPSVAECPSSSVEDLSRGRRSPRTRDDAAASAGAAPRRSCATSSLERRRPPGQPRTST